MNGGAGGPYWVSFPREAQGPLTLAASLGAGAMSVKPALLGCRGQEFRSCLARGALPPRQKRKRGRGMVMLTHPSSLLLHPPALGLRRGVVCNL